MEGLCADTFSSGPGGADPSHTLGDTRKDPDDDDGGIAKIESDATLNTPVDAEIESTNGAVNALLDVALMEVLRVDDFLSGTTGAEPSLSL